MAVGTAEKAKGAVAMARVVAQAGAGVPIEFNCRQVLLLVFVSL